MRQFRLWGAAMAAAGVLWGMPALAATAPAAANATLLQQLSFLNTGDLDFGDIVPGAAAGTVTVATTGARTTTGAVQSVGSAGQPSTFAGKGSRFRTVLISMSANAITLTGPGQSMRVDRWIIGSSPITRLSTSPTRFQITSANGLFAFPVGATLHVNANQAPGSYSGTFAVTLIYQ